MSLLGIDSLPLAYRLLPEPHPSHVDNLPPPVDNFVPCRGPPTPHACSLSHAFKNHFTSGRRNPSQRHVLCMSARMRADISFLLDDGARFLQSGPR